MSPAADPVAAWLRQEIRARRLKPSISDSAVVAIAGILLHAGSTNRTSKKNRHGLDTVAIAKEVPNAAASPARS